MTGRINQRSSGRRSGHTGGRRASRPARRLTRGIGNLIWLIWSILIFPIRVALAFRRAMTPASITLLLVGIVSANIVWGYPWVGVFSACLSLFIVGFLVNRWSLPPLHAEYVLPRMGTAGQRFYVQTILTNPSQRPAMELQIRLEPHRQRSHPRTATFQARLTDGSLAMIHPGERVSLNTSLMCQTRGLHRLPDVLLTTWFPFHLFRHTRRVDTHSTIAITPRLLDDDEDAFAGGLLDSLGDWTRKLLAGDAMDYTGSREYQPGMTVRRWDFPSWARLGQPIVREYQSPSVRSITLIVDTAIEPSESTMTSTDSSLDRDSLLERVLSLAATAVEQVCKHPIRVRLLVTGQRVGADQELGSDRETLLIRLAMATRQRSETARQEIADWCFHLDHQPVLILTARTQPSGTDPLPANVSMLRVDGSHVDVAAAPRMSDVETERSGASLMTPVST